VSELYGRKIVYFVSSVLLCVTVLVCGLAPNAGIFLAFRILSAFGSAAVLTVGAGTLADMFDPHERGTRMGIL
jgi:MFS family permease